MIGWLVGVWCGEQASDASNALDLFGVATGKDDAKEEAKAPAPVAAPAGPPSPLFSPSPSSTKLFSFYASVDCVFFWGGGELGNNRCISGECTIKNGC